MSKIAKLLSLTLILALCLTGCKTVAVDQAVDTTTVVAEYKDGTITKGDAKAMYDDVINYYTAQGYESALQDKDTVTEIKQDVLDYMVNDAIMTEKAKEFGVDQISEEERVQTLKDASDEYNSLIAMYSGFFQQEGATEEETRQATIQGLGMTEDDYKADALLRLKEQKLLDEVTKDVTVEEIDLRAAYDAKVEADKETYSATPGTYETARMNLTDPLWAPEGVRLVKHILLKPSEALTTERDSLRTKISEVEEAIDVIENPEGEEELELVLDEEVPAEGEETEENETTDESAEVEPAVGGATMDNTGDEPVIEAPETPVEVAAAEAEAATSDAVDTADETVADDVDAAADTEADIFSTADDAVETAADAETEESAEDEGVDLPILEADDEALSVEDFEPIAEDLSALSLDELKARLVELEDQMAAIDDQIKAELQPRVDEVEAKIAAGEDFDALVAEYGEDEGMNTYTDGYPVSEGSSHLDGPFKEGAMALANIGDISAPVYGMYGYHIIQYASDVTPGPVAFDTVKDGFHDEALETKKTTVFDETAAKWVEEAEVKTYPERL